MSRTKPLLLAKFTELILSYKLNVELTQCALFVFLSLRKKSKPETSLGDSILLQEYKMLCASSQNKKLHTSSVAHSKHKPLLKSSRTRTEKEELFGAGIREKSYRLVGISPTPRELIQP